MLKFGYKVVFFDSFYKKHTQKIISSSQQEALKTLNIDKLHLISCSKIIIDQLLVSQQEQNNILLEIASTLSSGQDASQNILKLLKNNKQLLNIAKKSTEGGDSLSETFLKIGFNKIVVAIISAGEQSGNISEAILESIDFNTADIEVKAKTKGVFKAQFFKFVFGFIAIFGLPFFLVEHIEKNITNANVFSQLLIYIGNNALLLSAILFALIILFIYLKPRIWQYIKSIKPFLYFERLEELKLSIVFLTMFKSMYFSGISFLNVIKNYEKVNIIVGAQFNQLVNSGVSPDQAMFDVGFEESFAKNMSSIISMSDVVVQKKSIDLAFKVLFKKLEIASDKVVSLVNLFAMILIVFAIALIAVGFYLPTMMVNF